MSEGVVHGIGVGQRRAALAWFGVWGNLLRGADIYIKI